MRLHQLVHLLDPNMTICIQDDDMALRYDSVDELRQDFIFYEEVSLREIREIWYSKNLYGCLVITLK